MVSLFPWREMQRLSITSNTSSGSQFPGTAAHRTFKSARIDSAKEAGPKVVKSPQMTRRSGEFPSMIESMTARA